MHCLQQWANNRASVNVSGSYLTHTHTHTLPKTIHVFKDKKDIK